MDLSLKELQSNMLRERENYNYRQDEEEEMYLYWLASIYKLSHEKKRGLLQNTYNIKEIYEVETLCKNPFLHLSDADIRVMKEAKNHWDLHSEYAKMKEKNIKIATYGDVHYPKRLLPYKDAPFALFYKGELPKDYIKTVAIVGARTCSHYGEKYASEYAGLLARCGVQVISGLARGIDGIAQRAAIEEGGTSYGVLGSGVDICYPRAHIGLYQDLTLHGGVISEVPLGTAPLALNFPLRNRIISGLSDAVIVIEAKERSGSLITADLALEQGKDVYALPGMVNSELSRGCNELIKQGAGLLNNPDEFMQELGISEQNKSRNTDENKKILETDEKLVYSCIRVDPQPLEAIQRECELPIQEVTNLLVSLELKGYIRQISRNYYVKL